MSEFRVWPGIERVYRLVILHGRDDYETITEADSVREIISAKRRAERAAAWTARALRRVFA